jgi:hypothetical protein
MALIHRNAQASQAARPFLESLFTTAGTELSAREIQGRCMKAGLDVSGSALMGVAMRMVEEGFLERPHRGFYRRPDAKGTPLAIPEVPPAQAPLSPEAADLLRLAGIDSRLIGLATKVDGLQNSLNQILDLLTAPK